MTPKDVLDLKETAKYLGMDEASLKLLAAERRIPCLTSLDTAAALVESEAAARSDFDVMTIGEWRAGAASG